MPTLVNVPESQLGSGNDGLTNRYTEVEDDGSETVFSGDERTIFQEEDCTENTGDCLANNKENKMGSANGSKHLPPTMKNSDKSVTLDGSFLSASVGGKPNFSRRDSLNSDVSLSLHSCDDTFAKDQSMLSKKSMNETVASFKINGKKPFVADLNARTRPRPRHDEYKERYEMYVKRTISSFKSKFPGKLRDYRSLSMEEKAKEQQMVLEFLTRLGVSTGKAFQASKTMTNPSPRRHDSPRSTNRMLDETLSPSFSPAPHDPGIDVNAISSFQQKEGNDCDEQDSFNQSNTICGKSELLLSMDYFENPDQDVEGPRDVVNVLSERHQKASPSGRGVQEFEFPMYNDNGDHSSNSSMEIVRKATLEEYNYSDRESPCLTPVDMRKSLVARRKREATTSGKRGADLRRRRQIEQEKDFDLTSHLGRLSISPSMSPPPKDLFIASQSPISPRLTCEIEDDGDDCFDRDYGERISLGKISYNHAGSYRQSHASDDSLATNTPPRRYQSAKEKRRAFRDVPANVALKKGATFHLEKIPIKRVEGIPTKTVKSGTNHTRLGQRRRFVNFADPLARYGSRRRRALKEIYSWARFNERAFEAGECSVPAAGIFFSLTEEQIIDVSLKLLLDDCVDNSENESFESNQSDSSRKGKTLVVLRAKEDGAKWESALRDGSGCSVLNHSTLPLSERIRSSTAEKACLHDVVLTTYDAMKSPDFTVFLDPDGHAILSKPETQNGWHFSRNSSEQDETDFRQTKQLSILHKIQFRRIIFVDTLGRKSYLAKSGTARAVASVALSSRTSRLAFFRSTDADGSNALLALRKSDKRALQSLVSIMHLADKTDESVISDSSNGHDDVSPIEDVAMDLKDLLS